MSEENIQILTEHNQDLQRENDDLKEKLEKTEKEKNRYWYQCEFENRIKALSTFIGILSILFLTGYPIYKNWTVPISPTHCEISAQCEMKDGESYCLYDLYGIIPWHSDIGHGRFDTLEEAIAARSLLCEDSKN
jgi:hypothetical protein